MERDASWSGGDLSAAVEHPGERRDVLEIGHLRTHATGHAPTNSVVLFIFPFATCVGDTEAGQVMGGLVIYNPSGLRVMSMV